MDEKDLTRIRNYAKSLDATVTVHEKILKEAFPQESQDPAVNEAIARMKLLRDTYAGERDIFYRHFPEVKPQKPRQKP